MWVLCDRRSDKEVKELKERFLTRGKSLPNLVIYVPFENFVEIFMWSFVFCFLQRCFISFSQINSFNTE